MESYGILTLLPLVVMLALVVVTKRVFEPILISIIIVFVMKDGPHFINGFIDTIYIVFASETYPWILLMLTLFGGLIALLLKSGGIEGFRQVADKFIKSQKSSLVFTWFLGLVLFIDDYINNLAIGPTVRKLTDEHKVPREGIGFVICSMGTPICSIVPLTAFAVFVFGVMKDNGISPENANLFSEYIKIIPFMFYPIAIILTALLFVLGIIPKVGPMKKRFQEGLSPIALEESVEAQAEGETVKQGHLIDFIIPVGVILVTMFMTNDLVFSVILAIFSAFLLYIPRKKMSVDHFFNSFFEGVTDMIFILVVILMTFVLVEGLNGIGFSHYVIDTITPYLHGGMIPMLTFVTVAVIAFLGVDYWAVMLLIAPIAIPLSGSFDVNPYLTMAAIASGSVFGGTTCFFAEQILMCSQSVEKKPVELAFASLPYNVSAFVLSSLAYLALGYWLS